MSKIGNWLSSLRAESVKHDNNDKTKDTATKPTAGEKPQMTEMPDIPLGRDLVKPAEKEKTKVDSYSYNNMLASMAELFVCQRQCDVQTVKKMIKEHPEVIEMLRQPEDVNGEELLNLVDICGIIINCEDDLINHQDKIQAAFSDPKQIEMLQKTPQGKRSVEFYRAMVDPLQSTVAINPEAFQK